LLSRGGLGGELGWDLDDREAAVLQGEGGLAALAAGAFDWKATARPGTPTGNRVTGPLVD
jgi:hypothetical protein